MEEVISRLDMIIELLKGERESKPVKEEHTIPPTASQMKLIKEIEKVHGFKFEGESLKDASKFISHSIALKGRP